EAEPGRGRAVVSGEDAGGWDARADDMAPGEKRDLPGRLVVLMRPQAQSSVVLVPPAGRSPAIFDLTMRNRPETLRPGKPQCCAESVTTLMSPRFGSSRPSNQALVDSDHSPSIVAGSSTNSTRPATESQLPASATLILTCGFVRSALAWSPSRARKNQTSASSVTSCAVIGCARIL